jgi:hypothetical protein
MATNEIAIGELVPTKIPGLSDRADIQAALRLYHYGSYTYNTSNTNAASLVNPSMAYTINDLQTQISALDITSTIQKSYLNAKGDLISASADNTPALLSVGTNGQVLTANSGTTSGLQWVTPEVTLTNTATLTNKTLTSPVINLSFNTQTLVTPILGYALVLSDNGKMIEVDNAETRTIIVPKNSAVAFPIGAQINISQVNDGQVTVSPVDGDVTINGTPGLKLRTKWSSATLIKRGTNSWILVGDLSA